MGSRRNARFLSPTADSPFPTPELRFCGLSLRGAFDGLLGRGFLRHGQFAVDGLVIAAFLGTVADRLFLLGVVFFEQERLAALRASFGHGLVPEYGVAIRILRTAVEDFSALRLLDQNLALAAGLHTRHARRLALDVFAIRVPRAGREFAERPMPDGQLRAAFGTLFFEHHRGRGHAGFRDLARGLALGVARAGEKLAEPPALERHGSAALLAGLVGVRILFGGALAVGGRRLGQLARVLAFGIIRAGEELAEATELYRHFRSALIADLVREDLLPLDVAHAVLGGLQVDSELVVKLLQRRRPCQLAVFDLVQLLLHPRRVLDVEQLGETLDQQVVDDHA